MKIEEEAQEISIKESDKEFIARFYSYCIVGLLIDWMKESPELLSDKMNEIMDGCIKRALKRFEIHQN